MYSSSLCSALLLQLHTSGHMTDCEQGISLQYTHITYSSESDALLPPFGQTRPLCCGTMGQVGTGSGRRQGARARPMLLAALISNCFFIIFNI